MNREQLKRAIEQLKNELMAGLSIGQPRATERGKSRNGMPAMLDRFEETKAADGYIISNKTEYMVYTNERWISPRWRWENPNLYWWQNKIEIVVDNWKSRVGGK